MDAVVTAQHKLALAYEHRPDTGGRVASIVVYRPDGHATVAATGDWQFSAVLERLALERG